MSYQCRYRPELITYMMYKCHACRVTEPLILSQLQAINIQISYGQINKILTNNLDLFHVGVKVNLIKKFQTKILAYYRLFLINHSLRGMFSHPYKLRV